MTGTPARILQTVLRGATATGRVGEIYLYERFMEIKRLRRVGSSILERTVMSIQAASSTILIELTEKNSLQRGLLTQR